MDKTKKLIIFGLEEIANVAHEYFTYDSEYEVVAFSVNKEYITSSEFKGCPVVPLEELIVIYPPSDYFVFVAMYSSQLNRNRAKIYNKIKEMGYRLANYISSKCFVWHNVEIGENCFILEDNTLQPFVKIGNNVTLWSGNHIGHSAKIRDNSFISSHVVISGFCEIGKNCFIGVNSAIANNVKIADDNYIAMSTSVNSDTKENQLLTGNPVVVSAVPAKRFCKVKEY